MPYTKDDFQEWIFSISDKMEFFTEKFAQENSLSLNYAVESLDELEKWILSNYTDRFKLIEDSKILDLLTIYIGETFRKKIGGKWFMDLENKENAYYHMPVLTSEKYKGERYVASLTYATACISRKKGNYISSILKNNMKDMGIE